ncbi:MAG: FtsK/SpoIIIE domain-containing protein, partial [Egibacteraceae bacterium]
MQVVVRHAGRVREIDLVVEGPDACVADLVGAVTGSAETGAGVALEGRFFGPDAGLDEIGLHEGALIDVTVAAPRPSPPPAGPALAVIGGPVSGALHSLPDDEVLIGRTLDCGVTIPDPTISAQHVRLRHLEDGSWEATDLGSHNGTWIDGSAAIGPTRVGTGSLLRLGASHVRVLGKLPDDRPLAVDPLFRASGGLVPFNRPPRPALPPEPLSEVAPEPPQQQRSGRAFSIIAFITPLLLGGAMIYFFRNPRFALFMLLSPLMLVGNWLTSRRQAKKERRVSSREFKEAMERLETHLRDAVTVETARREELLPDPAEIMRRAREPSTALWQRRPDDPDFLRLRAGIADVAWQPPVENPGQQARELPEQVATLVNRYAVLPRTPVEIDLSGGGVVGLVGDRDAALALARSLVCQAAVHHGPADCAMVVLARPHHAGDWDWAKWLPHVRDASGATRMLSGDPQTSAELLGSLLESAGDDDGGMFKAGQRQQPGGPTRLVVLDDTSLIEGRRAPARLVLSGKAGPVAGIVLAETVDQLPAVTSTVIELDSDLGNATLRRPQQGVVVAGLVVAGTTDVLARDCARCLARYEDPELEVPGAGLPSLVRLLPLLGMDEVDAAAVAKRWAEAGSEPAPRTPVGIGEDGIVSLNLVRDGPHGLIGGTTGSGKSELLRSLVAGLAAGTEPEHLVFVLVDYKGGSAFDECARLPHTVGMVTDLDEHLGERALRSLEAELSQRERTLRAAGTQDLPAYLQLGAPLGPLPRLLVVIDEFATLATELPDFLGALVGVAQRGRSLGVHLLLATQRPSGAVNANIKANTNLRIALRVQDDTDSTDIIDRRDAARISRANPGRAYVRLGPGDVLLVQSALSTARLGSGTASAGVRLAPFRFGPLPAPRDDDGVLSEQGPSDLQRLVVAVREAFHASGQSEPRKPWLQMLSEQIDLADILGRDDAGGVPVPLALADEPERQRQVPVGWDPAQGHLALFGMVGSGTSSALLAVARALASRHGPDDCHLYGLDFGTRRLAPLADLPHAGAVVGATETEAQYRVIRHLRRELDRRRTLSPDELDGEPLVVTIVDGVAALLAEFDSIENLETGDAFKRVFS